MELNSPVSIPGSPFNRRNVLRKFDQGPGQPSPAQSGPVRPARPGPARPSLAGSSWPSLACAAGLVRLGWAWPTWPGLARPGPAWPGVARPRTCHGQTVFMAMVSPWPWPYREWPHFNGHLGGDRLYDVPPPPRIRIQRVASRPSCGKTSSLHEKSPETFIFGFSAFARRAG